MTANNAGFELNGKLKPLLKYVGLTVHFPVVISRISNWQGWRSCHTTNWKAFQNKLWNWVRL